MSNLQKFINQITCDCGHPVAVHNQYNCTYANETENECHCPLGKETIIARYYARLFRSKYEKLKKLMDRPDIQQYLAWWNANHDG